MFSRVTSAAPQAELTILCHLQLTFATVLSTRRRCRPRGRKGRRLGIVRKSWMASARHSLSFSLSTVYSRSGRLVQFSRHNSTMRRLST